MNILFLTIYGKNDTRTRAFIRILKRIGYLICVSKKIEEKTVDVDSPDDIVFNYRGVRDVGSFIKAAYLAKKRLGHVDLLFLDNRMAAILNFLFGKKCRYVIQDAREFYSIKETSHLVGKIGCIIEKRSLQKADMVICANKQRAELMKERFRLSETPVVYENIFPMEYDKFFSKKEVEKKYNYLFNNGKRIFISSAGCQVERTTDKLVLAAKQFEDKMKLLLVGGASETDIKTIESIIEKNHISNVSIIGYVDTNTLKYLMSRSDVGVVIYGKHNENNRYCASGKMYEYLNEQLPIIASENEPLIDFINTTHTGIASDNYEDAFRLMLKSYSEYKENVKRFCDAFDPDFGNEKLEMEIIHRLKKVNN